jgi:hypothetical protein
MTDITSQYLLLYVTSPDGEPWSEADDDIADWLDSVKDGISVMGERLAEPEGARLVTKRAGSVTVTEGPFAEYTEWFAGFDLINAPDADTAAEIASRHPAARYGKAFVLPLMDAVRSNALFEATVRARSGH